MAQNRFPPGWDEERVHKVLARYETQSEEEAVAEDEAAFERSGQTVMEGAVKRTAFTPRMTSGTHGRDAASSWTG